MPKETKSNGQKDLLDRFYTPIETVAKCLSLIDFNKYDCIIEPSAGTGNFLTHFPTTCKVYGFDIAPEADNIEEADWFLLDKSQFSIYNSILVCGNPPFGQQNTIAIDFFNEAAKFCNTIAFILPLSFKKSSVQNRLNLNFYLEQELVLENCEFLLQNETVIKVPCVFQIWTKQQNQREKVKLPTTTSLFDFVNKERADLRIQRVGGNAGKASLDLNRSPSSNYFVKNNTALSNDEFVNFINSLTFPTIEFTVGPKSLSKGELIAIIEENIGNFKKI